MKKYFVYCYCTGYFSIMSNLNNLYNAEKIIYVIKHIRNGGGIILSEYTVVTVPIKSRQGAFDDIQRELRDQDPSICLSNIIPSIDNVTLFPRKESV